MISPKRLVAVASLSVVSAAAQSNFTTPTFNFSKTIQSSSLNAAPPPNVFQYHLVDVPPAKPRVPKFLHIFSFAGAQNEVLSNGFVSSNNLRPSAQETLDLTAPRRFTLAGVTTNSSVGRGIKNALEKIGLRFH